MDEKPQMSAFIHQTRKRPDGKHEWFAIQRHKGADGTWDHAKNKVLSQGITGSRTQARTSGIAATRRHRQKILGASTTTEEFYKESIRKSIRNMIECYDVNSINENSENIQT